MAELTSRSRSVRLSEHSTPYFAFFSLLLLAWPLAVGYLPTTLLAVFIACGRYVETRGTVSRSGESRNESGPELGLAWSPSSPTLSHTWRCWGRGEEAGKSRDHFPMDYGPWMTRLNSAQGRG